MPLSFSSIRWLTSRNHWHPFFFWLTVVLLLSRVGATVHEYVKNDIFHCLQDPGNLNHQLRGGLTAHMWQNHTNVFEKPWGFCMLLPLVIDLILKSKHILNYQKQLRFLAIRRSWDCCVCAWCSCCVREWIDQFLEQTCISCWKSKLLRSSCSPKTTALARFFTACHRIHSLWGLDLNGSKIYIFIYIYRLSQDKDFPEQIR